MFGWLVPALSRALEAELQVPKAYVLFLAEQEGFDHLHVHVIARPPEYARGINVFQLIQRPSDEWVSAADMDALAERVGPRLVALRQLLARGRRAAWAAQATSRVQPDRSAAR